MIYTKRPKLLNVTKLPPITGVRPVTGRATEPQRGENAYTADNKKLPLYSY